MKFDPFESEISFEGKMQVKIRDFSIGDDINFRILAQFRLLQHRELQLPKPIHYRKHGHHFQCVANCPICLYDPANKPKESWYLLVWNITESSLEVFSWKKGIELGLRAFLKKLNKRRHKTINEIFNLKLDAPKGKNVYSVNHIDTSPPSIEERESWQLDEYDLDEVAHRTQNNWHDIMSLVRSEIQPEERDKWFPMDGDIQRKK